MATYEPHDRFYRKAREAGLPSRAAFKLEELIERTKLVGKGARIVDLGCAPGGWLVILARVAGPSGKIVGVDLAAVKNPPAGCVTIVGDILDPEVAKQAEDALGSKADLVTSDLAPKLTGIAVRDEARSRELIETALAFASRTLKLGGAMIVKIFMSGEFNQVVAGFKDMFASVETTRTKASRPGSAELYIVAKDFRA